MKRFLLFGILIFAFAGNTGYGETLSLSQAQAEAAQHSPELQKFRSASDSASWKKLEAASVYLPHLSVGASQVLDQKYLYLGVKFGGAAINFPEAFPSSTLDLNASETLFDGLGAWHSYRAADLAEDAANLDLQDVSFRLDRQVRLRYEQALAASLLAKVADQNILTLQAHLDQVQASEKSGLATRFEVLRVQSKLEEAKAEKILEDDNAVLARGMLGQALGSQSPEMRDLGGELPVPDPALLQAKDLSSSARADLGAQALRAEAAQQAESASGSFWLPRISIFGQDQYYKYNSYDPAIIPSNGFQQDYTVGLNLNWDIFDGGLSLARQKEAEKSADQAALALASQQLKQPADLEQGRRRYLYNASLYQARLRSQEESEESVRLAQLGLKAGTLTHTETLDAESDLFRARAGVVRAQMDAAEALINLELALGRSLE